MDMNEIKKKMKRIFDILLTVINMQVIANSCLFKSAGAQIIDSISNVK